MSTLPVALESAAIISALVSLGGWGAINGEFRTERSLHVLTADVGTPSVSVTPRSGYYLPDCDPTPASVPLPLGGAIEGSTDYTCPFPDDCHLLVVAKHERRLYEMYQTNQAPGGGPLLATCLVIWDLTKQYSDVLRGDQCTSADAAGLPMAPLLATADEAFAGDIPHALRFTLPNPRIRPAVYVRPATHAGGPVSTNPSAPPYGVRFRLKATFDETRLAAPGARVIARALKRYGMILSDGGNIPLTIASDRFTTHRWADVGITDDRSLALIRPDDFEVVALGPTIPLTYNCVRVP